MMIPIHFDAKTSDDLRRERLYEGHVFVYSPSRSSLALSQLGREMAEEAFAPYDP